ncbi:MAG: ferritin-like domain-containing protein [Burkholderiales bacterium]|nr:ferritin-like domain-containing protein [Burkholderiales bacterium]
MPPAIRSVMDTDAMRIAARHFEEPVITPCYRSTREKMISLLNGALATELVCTLRYKRHYYTVTGVQNGLIKAEFLQHAKEEQQHADLLAERIVQLHGKPDFNPAKLLAHSHAAYDDSEDVQAMIMANLIAERTAIEAYRQMIIAIGDSDPTTTHLLVGIMVMEEGHADDMRDFLR